MVQVVDLGEVADVEFVDEGEVHLRVFEVQMTLKVTGVFHCKDDLLFGQIVLAEDVETVFVEVSIEA